MKDGGQAFPLPDRDDALKGMTLRQWYAGMALQGMLSNPFTSNYLKEFYNDSGKEGEFMVHNAFKAADAMIAHEAKESA